MAEFDYFADFDAEIGDFVEFVELGNYLDIEAAIGVVNYFDIEVENEPFAYFD